MFSIRSGPVRCAGDSYEPPLTNVFSMQWLLTLFATCLPKATVLRLWDCVLLEGSEVLLRAALSLWHTLAPYVRVHVLVFNYGISINAHM